VRALTLAALLASLPLFAHADEITLRMASIAPDGTAWARELRAVSRQVETETGGTVHLHWYLGGIAGDEHTSVDRIRRGQLDGVAGASMCLELSPTMNVMRVVGLVQSRAEGLYLLNQIRPQVDEDIRRAGFEELALGGFGNETVLLREPVSSLAELRKVPIWVWSADELVQEQMRAMGLHIVPADVTQLSAIYDAGKVDAMFVIPAAALAFQWTTRARYFVDLKASYLPGCLVVATRAFDLMTHEQRQVLRAAGAKFAARFEDAGLRDDALLFNGLFEKQGLKRLKASESLRDEFFNVALEAREHIEPRLLPRALLVRALTVLNDYRTEHP
jgi:TRAP-type C4-dicarboxylate transport system substrate-binding protein